MPSGGGGPGRGRVLLLGGVLGPGLGLSGLSASEALWCRRPPRRGPRPCLVGPSVPPRRRLRRCPSPPLCLLPAGSGGGPPPPLPRRRPAVVCRSGLRRTPARSVLG